MEVRLGYEADSDNDSFDVWLGFPGEGYRSKLKSSRASTEILLQWCGRDVLGLLDGWMVSRSRFKSTSGGTPIFKRSKMLIKLNQRRGT